MLCIVQGYVTLDTLLQMFISQERVQGLGSWKKNKKKIIKGKVGCG